jgi:hypothetical protein
MTALKFKCNQICRLQAVPQKKGGTATHQEMKYALPTQRKIPIGGINVLVNQI